MFWHLEIWISFGLWILKFGFFIFVKLLMAWLWRSPETLLSWIDFFNL